MIAQQKRMYIAYNLPTCSMDPTYTANQKVLGSSLFPVHKGDIVSYRSDPLPLDKISEPYEVIVRIVAEENDTLQIINGLLYINNKFEDDTMKYSYFFKVANNEVSERLTEYQTKYKTLYFSSDSLLLNASYNELQILKLNRIVPRYIDTTLTIRKYSAVSEFKNDWTTDNFGPVVIPTDSYFLLGDNRSNSADSRFRGFIHKDNIVAKILMGN